MPCYIPQFPEIKLYSTTENYLKKIPKWKET